MDTGEDAVEVDSDLKPMAPGNGDGSVSIGDETGFVSSDEEAGSLSSAALPDEAGEAPEPEEPESVAPESVAPESTAPESVAPESEEQSDREQAEPESVPDPAGEPALTPDVSDLELGDWEPAETELGEWEPESEEEVFVDAIFSEDLDADTDVDADAGPVYDPLATPPEMSQVLFVDVVLLLPATNPVVVLQESDPPYRELRIPVGGAEGIAIAYAARGITTPRPLTHELLTRILEEFGMTLDVVRITEVRGSAFSAEMVISGKLGARVIDCRPSDGIALALRQRLPPPIMVAPSVLTRAGTDPAGAN